MKLRRIWALVSGCLFLAWIGWLFYLVLTTTRPIILSRPQFLASTLDVIADIAGQDGVSRQAVMVADVHWPVASAEALKGKALTVTNITECAGWLGPGRYILPLIKEGDAYRVVSIPPSPGFPSVAASDQPRIYLYNSQTARQLATIPKAESDHRIPSEH